MKVLLGGLEEVWCLCRSFGFPEQEDSEEREFGGGGGGGGVFFGWESITTR